MAPRRNILNSNHDSSSPCASRNTRNSISGSNIQSSNNLRSNVRRINQFNNNTNNENLVNESSGLGVQLRRSRRIANLRNLASTNDSISLLQYELVRNRNNNNENTSLNESRNSTNSRINRQSINRNVSRQNLRNSNSNSFGIVSSLNTVSSRRRRRNLFHFSTSFNSNSSDNQHRQRHSRIRDTIHRSILNPVTSYNIINLNDTSQRRRVISRQSLINNGWRGISSSFMTFGNLVPTRTMIDALFTPANILRNDDDEEWPRTTEMVSDRYHRDISSDDTMDDLLEERRYPRRSSYNDTRRRIRSYATNIRRRRNSNFGGSIRFFSSFPLQVPPEGLEERLASIFPQGTSTLDIRNRKIMESPKPFPVPKDEIEKGISSEPEKCTICFEDICVDPVKCLHCRQQIGCFDCLKKWIRADAYVNSNQEEYVMHSKNMACPLCRHEWSYASRPEVFRLQNK